MFPHGFFRITAAAPHLAIANPTVNAARSIEAIDANPSDLVLLPELGLTGYTCGDLFGSETLLDAAEEALQQLVEHSRSHGAIVVAGLPWRVDVSLMNVAAIIADGKLHGLVPKTFLPTYREFYEGRHFRGASEADPKEVTFAGQSIPFGTDLLFQWGQAVVAVELCEDLWMPVPPSADAALAGANVLLNLSASNETIGKAAWRRDLIRSQSGRCLAAYAYTSAGPGESTSDLVFGGHCLIAENGGILGESRRVGDGRDDTVVSETSVTRDVDLQHLNHDRRITGSFDDYRSAKHAAYRRLTVRGDSGAERQPPPRLLRHIDAHPFVPDKSGELEARCAEIFSIQTAGLVKRLSRLRQPPLMAIGISGGLDSTLALLVALRACDAMDIPRSQIHGITMPGFGTTQHTRESADRLIQATGITGECVDVRQLCLDTFRSLGHAPLGIEVDESTTVETLQQQLIQQGTDVNDLTFENVQARVRTLILMSRGFVLGTGDMSEQALGWSTYNGDHMSMYNVNTSVPKTLVRFMVRHAADHYFKEEVSELLHRIADTPISPELLPPDVNGEIQQDTEAHIGSYELHDFFLYHFVRFGSSREKILYLAQHADFHTIHPAETIAETLETFLDRFFANQFKRNCVPDGPKVGSVSLSPRGDWRMPSDADRF